MQWKLLTYKTFSQNEIYKWENGNQKNVLWMNKYNYAEHPKFYFISKIFKIFLIILNSQDFFFLFIKY